MTEIIKKKSALSNYISSLHQRERESFKEDFSTGCLVLGTDDPSSQDKGSGEKENDAFISLA